MKRYRTRYRLTLPQAKMSLEKDSDASAVPELKTSESVLNTPLAESHTSIT